MSYHPAQIARVFLFRRERTDHGHFRGLATVVLSKFQQCARPSRHPALSPARRQHSRSMRASSSTPCRSCPMLRISQTAGCTNRSSAATRKFPNVDSASAARSCRNEITQAQSMDRGGTEAASVAGTSPDHRRNSGGPQPAHRIGAAHGKGDAPDPEKVANTAVRCWRDELRAQSQSGSKSRAKTPFQAWNVRPPAPGTADRCPPLLRIPATVRFTRSILRFARHEAISRSDEAPLKHCARSVATNQ